jgi:hypothetical protein
VVERDLPIAFVPQQLTSYGGLELLRRFTLETLRPLIRLNQELVLETLARLEVSRLTLDVDGTIVRTGAAVAWAFRGFNPHNRKKRSYYPLLAHVAQTGHILRVKNRPGKCARLQAVRGVPP